MSVPRALWSRAPVALAGHVAVAVAVCGASALLALAAASAPLLRAGANSEALKSQLSELSPLGAGLTIETPDAPLRSDAGRRAAIGRIAAPIPNIRAPIVTVSTIASLPSPGGRPFEVVPMARDGATAHVKRLSGDGRGAWLAQGVAKVSGVRAGDTISLIGESGRPIRLRVGAIYLQLDQDIDNPYWVNFIVRIRTRNPDSPPLPTFLFVDRATVFRIAHALNHDVVRNTFELPVEPSAMTTAKARRLQRDFAAVRQRLPDSGLGCPCAATSPLSAATRLAALSVDALAPVITLLAAFAGALAVAAAVAAGAFGVRRRSGEAELSVARGEPAVAFGLRASLEAFLPSLLGGALGVGAALAATAAFTPDGTVDSGTTRDAVVAGALAVLAAAAAAAAGAMVARGPLLRRDHRRRFVPPWEVGPLGAAAVVIWVVESGNGLTRNDAVGAHPRLAVLALPLLVAAGGGGVLIRVARRPLRAARPHTHPLFLAVRRLAAARSLLVLLAVTGSAAVAALAFAEILDSTLRTSTAEKAYVANGADVQGVVDPYQRLPAPLPYPATRVVQDFENARIDGSANSLELMSVQPKELARVIRWRWSGDPQRALERLAASDATLPAIANGSAADAKAIFFGGRRIRVTVVEVVRSFPGMVEGKDVLVVPAAKLERLVPRPYEGDTAYVWVKGPPQAVTIALERAEPAPVYITTVHHFLQSADLETASRTYGYVRVVAAGAALVALLALVLYLRARARRQVVTSALLERMGMRSGRRAIAAAIVSAAIATFACVVGTAAALATARPIVTRVDPIPQYAPRAALDVPWLTLAGSVLVVVALAAVAGALASIVRANLAEAVRVA